MVFKTLLPMACVFILAVNQGSEAVNMGFSQSLDPSTIKLKDLASSSLGANSGKNMFAAPVIPLIDNSIDADSYIVGGGDVFSIHILELPSIEYSATVDQNCDVTIPDLGLIKVGRKTLTEAKSVIADYVKSKIKKQYEIYVSLTRTKTAVITVSGAVSNPGTYQVEGTTRLLDVLRMANNLQLPPFNYFNYREVVCVNKGAVKSFDLFRFLMTSDLTQNPYVYPGDNILLKVSASNIYISGAVRNAQGMLPIKQGETVAGVLSLLTLDASADSENIIVSKSDEHGRQASVVFSLKNPGPLTLSDHDIVVVSQKSNYPRIDTVRASGEIARPGYYPIIWKKTTARNIIEQAGGATQFGNFARAFIIRRGKINGSENAATGQLSMSAARNSANFVRPEVGSALSQMANSSDYAIFPVENDGQETLLDPGDEIVVPKIETMVYVSGSVRMPGAYAFVAGKGPDYYVNKAGGYTSKADRDNVFVMMRYADISQIKENNRVQEGNIIVVPESTQYKYFSVIIYPIIMIVLTAISTTVTTYSIFHK
jgi:protein involved in polysaccharide export with SLBB domain